MPTTAVMCKSDLWPELCVAGAPKQRNYGDFIDETGMKLRHEEQMPVIDRAMLQKEAGPGSESKKARECMARACKTWGFFQLVNHGIDASLLAKVKEVSIEFFKEAEEEKLRYQVRPGVVEGFNSSSLSAVGSNKLTHSVDHLYYLTSPSRRNLSRWPQHPPSYRGAVIKYATEMQSLAEELMSILSVELGLEGETLYNRLAGSGEGELTQSMRTNYYAPVSTQQSPDEPDNLCKLGAHSDPGGLTVLLQNDVAGFEVKKDGRWVQVDAMPNALVVNIGDQIEILSNGIYKSIEHRGNAHRTKERLTIATFLSPNYEAVVEPINELVGHNQPALYRSIKYQDYFSKFVVKGLDGKEHVRAAAGRTGMK